MKILNILIVDDNPEWSRALLKRLGDRNKFRTHLRAEADGAIEISATEQFDVAFIDLDLSGPPKPGEERRDPSVVADLPVLEGIDVCSKVHDNQRNALIVIYSAHIRPGFPYIPQCKSAGADEILSRTELLTLSSVDLADKIAQWIAAKKSAKSVDNSHFDYDSSLRTQALIETFGSDNLEALFLQGIPNSKYFQVSALQAGYSGAGVVRIKASSNANFADSAHLVAKISRSDFSLADELKRRPVPGSHFDSNAKVPHSSSVVQNGGLYAIFLPEVRNMVLLREFLAERAKNGDNAKLKRIVEDLLILPAKEAIPWKEFGGEAASYQFRVAACSELSEFLDESSKWTGLLRKQDIRCIQVAQQFLESMVNGHWAFTATDRHVAKLHGDFHCRNVFLSPKDGPLLIDFGRSDYYPRLFDFAALDSDLIISVISSGNGRDYSFSDIDKWGKAATALFPFANRCSVGSPRTRAEILRNILLEEMNAKLKNVTPLEYAEVLLFQMLRYVRFPNIPPPKKILALHIISQLAKQFGFLTNH